MHLLYNILTIGPALLVAVILHEIAHGYVAKRLGDPTASVLGRLTLNPLKHIDPFMTVILPGVLILSGSPIVFGGAKPVPVDARNFKRPRRDMGIVAIAGPITNIILAGISYLILLGVIILLPQSTAGSPVLDYAKTLLVYSILINVVLASFNLVPVPPLDGGRIAVALLPRSLALRYARIERYGLMIIVLLLYFGIIDRLLGPVLSFVLRILGIS